MHVQVQECALCNNEKNYAMRRDNVNILYSVVKKMNVFLGDQDNVYYLRT